EMENCIEIVECNLKPVQDVEPILRFLEVKCRPSPNNLPTMGKKKDERTFQCKKPRTAINNRKQNDTERLLHWRHLVELVQHYGRDCLSLQFNDDSHSVTVGLVS